MASGKENPEESEKPRPSPHSRGRRGNTRRPIRATFETRDEYAQGQVHGRMDVDLLPRNRRVQPEVVTLDDEEDQEVEATGYYTGDAATARNSRNLFKRLDKMEEDIKKHVERLMDASEANITLQIEHAQANTYGAMQDIAEGQISIQRVDYLLGKIQRLIRARRSALERAEKTFDDHRKEVLELQAEIKDLAEYKCKDEGELEQKNSKILNKVNYLIGATKGAFKEMTNRMEYGQPGQPDTDHELDMIARGMESLRTDLSNAKGQIEA